jgi:Tc toxin complex TcA C-terminal TcB-binding domain
MSAMLLSQNQQFEDADTWFRFIFNPMDTSNDPAPQKFWVTKPFFTHANNNISLDEQIIWADQHATDSFWNTVKKWQADPDDPHVLAQARITPYMYTTYMKYLDNLIAWANYNYTQYTMESVNIAIQLFMLAQETLGPKPEAIPDLDQAPPSNYSQLETSLDFGQNYLLSDPIVSVENIIPIAPSATGAPTGGKQIPILKGLYFCIPPNEVLLSYWDTVETQLYKIQNCLNIEGQFQPLSPFPNVPGMNGADSSSINDFGGVIPNYRFSIMIQKATDLCNEVKSLGAALLSTLEKNDAEGLALLHATQEVAVQQAVDKVKVLQQSDAQLGLQNLQNYQSLIQDKITYYSGLTQNGGLIPLEIAALALNTVSLALEGPITASTMITNALKMVPNFVLGVDGFGGSPSVNASFGGEQLGGAADAMTQMLSFVSHFADKSASIATTVAGYTRRLAEWQFQLQLAQDELTQVNTQIQSAQTKIDIANQEEQNQQLLIQNAEDIQSFLQDKYTNQQLYSWMITQISGVYFQSYQLAYSIAKQAEICFRYELGITNTSYINYGYWNSLQKGLLSGEALMSNIKQMEMDYLGLNNREYELTRQISLAQLDPAALQQLKSNNSCYLNIPEELFDLDYPGQYFRRIKHVAITLPGVVGPYTPVCLKMTLMNNSVRMVNTAGSAASYSRNTDSTGAPTNDSRFLDNVSGIQYMATSSGVNDNGLFELNLHDDRYLPFERAGAISSWQLELTSVYPQFDPASITDLIIHLSYTSRDGGSALQTVAAQSLQKKMSLAMSAPGLVLMRAFSARRDFPTQWYKFLNPIGTDPQTLDMDITHRFPYFTQGGTVKITSVVVLADIPDPSVNTAPSSLYLSGTKLSNALINFGPDPEYGAMSYGILSVKDSPGLWTITNGTTPGSPAIPADSINDLYVVFYYTLKNA